MTVVWAGLVELLLLFNAKPEAQETSERQRSGIASNSSLQTVTQITYSAVEKTVCTVCLQTVTQADMQCGGEGTCTVCLAHGIIAVYLRSTKVSPTVKGD